MDQSKDESHAHESHAHAPHAHASHAHGLARQLPHHKLVAFAVAKDFLVAILAAKIADGELRNQATRAAKSVALNIAEAAGRASAKDKARVFTIARGELVEAIAALEIAVLIGAASQASLRTALPLADRLVALLTGLCRH